MTVPLLLVLGPLLAEISLLLVNSASSSFSRAGQAPRTWGRLAALLVGKVVLVELERRPSFLATNTVLMATTSPSRQAGQVDGGSTGDKICVDGHDLPLQAGHTLARRRSDSQSSNCPHYDISALSEFIPRVHPCIWI